MSVFCQKHDQYIQKMFGFLFAYSIITMHFSLVGFFYDVDSVNSDRTAEV